ncbi:hypothetical protein, partial [Bacteroides sp. OF04-15BH]|uniref:hypothetical protein n=1 Tax=Bacteroides sp. OF04-15BH TaxID=2292281 RepID=UPI000FEEFB19
FEKNFQRKIEKRAEKRLYTTDNTYENQVVKTKNQANKKMNKNSILFQGELLFFENQGLSQIFQLTHPALQDRRISIIKIQYSPKCKFHLSEEKGQPTAPFISKGTNQKRQNQKDRGYTKLLS